MVEISIYQIEANSKCEETVFGWVQFPKLIQNHASSSYKSHEDRFEIFGWLEKFHGSPLSVGEKLFRVRWFTLKSGKSWKIT